MYIADENNSLNQFMSAHCNAGFVSKRTDARANYIQHNALEFQYFAGFSRVS